MKKTNISIGKTEYPDGTKKIKARVKELGTTHSSNVLDFEKKFNELRERLKKQVKKADKKNGDAYTHWKLGDMVIEFEKYAEKQGFKYNVNTQPLVKYVGKSEAYWMLHKRFRKKYASKDDLDERIPWKMYIPLMHENNIDKRKRYEKMIINGEIESQNQLWGMIKEMKSNGNLKKNKMSDGQLKVLNALKEKDMTYREIAEHTGLSPDSVRGRKTELVHRFGCNIKIVDGRYHLDEDKTN